MQITGVQIAGAVSGSAGVNHDQPGWGSLEASQRELIQAVKAINAADMFGPDGELTFVIDRQTHKAVARVVSKRTGEILMQLPPEQVLRMQEERK